MRIKSRIKYSLMIKKTFRLGKAFVRNFNYSDFSFGVSKGIMCFLISGL